jgi:electron transport complex protein RnfG
VPDTAKTEKHTLKVDGTKVAVFECRDASDKLVGWAIDHTGGGFIDKIRVVTGLAPDLSEIIGMKALAHLETPGLGSKIDTKGDKNFYPLQYAGKLTAEPLVLTKQTPVAPNEIQAITGATYSSQYVMDIVNEVITKIRPQVEALRNQE